MTKRFRPWDPKQKWLLPPEITEFIPEGHPAHFVRDLVVEELDLTAILDTYVEDKGYPPFHPAMMVALLLYAYTQGVFSSRKIAKACIERMDFAAVTGFQKPDFRTISLFRKASPDRPGRAVPAGAGAMPAGRAGGSGPCGPGWDQGQGQCEQAQGHELRPDGKGGKRIRRGGEGLVGPSGDH